YARAAMSSTLLSFINTMGAYRRCRVPSSARSEAELLEVDPRPRHARRLELRDQRLRHRRRAADQDVYVVEVAGLGCDCLRRDEPPPVARERDDAEVRGALRDLLELVEVGALAGALHPVEEMHAVL